MTRRFLPFVFLACFAFASPAPAHADAPWVTTGGASISSGTAATFTGSASPGGETTTAWFRYATVSPGTCNDTFGTRAPSSGGAALGDGTSAQVFTEDLTGLAPGTRYYFCAIASNATGTAYGSVVSFTMPLPPSVTTSPAQSIGSYYAVLYANVNPNGASTTGWFRYAAENPGACDDTFGTRAPASDGSALGTGTSARNYNRQILGLTQGTTYYYCAIATNSEGTSYGSVLSFTTTQPPIVATSPATSVTGTGATLNGSANPAGLATTGWFRYGTVDPGTCDDTFGTRTPPSSGGTSIAAGSAPVEFSSAVTGLAPATTYYYCAIARNSLGLSVGAVQSFTTPTTAPLVATAGVSSATGRGATLHASVHPAGASATGWFRYATVSPGACNDTFGTRAPPSGGAALGAGTSAQAFSESVTGLSPGTTYYYCAIASNSEGAAYGAVVSFTTPTAPAVTTSPATSVSGTGAWLQGIANPNRASTTGWFRYATVDPGTCDDAFGTRTPEASDRAFGAGSTTISYTQWISGLTPGTTYYYCAIAASSEGTSFGAVLSFTTLLPPTVATSPATSITGSGATLNGSATPGGATATGWFRFGSSDPGACDDAFGTRTPSSGGTALGAGNAPVDFAQVVTGLAPVTTYHYCAVAESGGGRAFGAVRSFTTGAIAPTVANAGVSSVTATGATLHASANPGGASTTGWFRYGTINSGVCSDTFGTRAPSSDGPALGAGTGSQAFSQTVTGLSPGTTYYYCPVASNSEGTVFGWVASFTTAAAAVVTTTPATWIWARGATLNATANPNGASAVGWFRYASENPGACDDSFGTRAPASGGLAIGGGSTVLPFSQSVGGLAPATRYYYCAIVENAAGKQFGALVQFATHPLPPTVTTAAPTDVTRDSAVLNGAAVPNSAEATGWFRWYPLNPGTCSDTWGMRTPASGGLALGAGTAEVPFSSAISGLTRGTTYYYCAIAQNAQGLTVGEPQTFVPGSTTPTVMTNEAYGIGGEVATLSGTANPNGRSATGWFRFGDSSPAACDDSFGARVPASGGHELGDGTSAVTYEESLSSLEPNQAYWYCAAAAGVGGATFGEVRSFITAPVPPEITTLAAVVGDGGAVTLEGLANPRGMVTSAWFRVGEADPGACDDTFGTRWPSYGATEVGAGRSAVAYSQDVTGLAPGRYYACALGSSPAGTAAGAVVSFEIPRPSSSSGGCGTGVPGGFAAVALGLLALLGRRRRSRLRTRP